MTITAALLVLLALLMLLVLLVLLMLLMLLLAPFLVMTLATASASAAAAGLPASYATHRIGVFIPIPSPTKCSHVNTSKTDDPVLSTLLYGTTFNGTTWNN
jgi:hypothetical protein